MDPRRIEDWVPRPGTVIDGRYEVEALVGNGTMGAVVCARHLVLDRRVAIKLLRPERAVDPVAVERFRQEASAASRIRSDHVVRIHDVGATDLLLFEALDIERGPIATIRLPARLRMGLHGNWAPGEWLEAAARNQGLAA